MRGFILSCLLGTLFLLTAFTGMFSQEPVRQHLPVDVGKIHDQQEAPNFIDSMLAADEIALVLRKAFNADPGIASSGIYIEKWRTDYRNALRHYANMIRTREIVLAKKYASRKADKPDVVCNGQLACKLTS